jgi:hypothetical protein
MVILVTTDCTENVRTAGDANHTNYMIPADSSICPFLLDLFVLMFSIFLKGFGIGQCFDAIPINDPSQDMVFHREKE